MYKRQILGDVKILALGGATEASIWSNCFEVPERIPEKWKSIPYGKPLANQRYYILDQNMENCPDWVPGDLYIAGTGVAQGYLNDEERTKEKFIIWETTGERLYTTGDVGRYWKDGNIEFLGRVDNQIKINGYRVELGEIEAALLELQGVKKAMVFLKQSTSKETIGAVLVEGNKYYGRESEFYKKMLAKKLPVYMIPTEYLKVKDIPLNMNGKKDIQKIINLANQKQNVVSDVMDKQESLSQLQTQLLSIWREILKNETIGINDNFFEAGGNSLQAIQITNQMTEKTGHIIDIGNLFEHPTVSEIERYILEDKENGDTDLLIYWIYSNEQKDRY